MHSNIKEEKWAVLDIGWKVGYIMDRSTFHQTANRQSASLDSPV